MNRERRTDGKWEQKEGIQQRPLQDDRRVMRQKRGKNVNGTGLT